MEGPGSITHFVPLIPAKAGTQVLFTGAFCVYIMASGRNGTLYIGHTDDLVRRILQHRRHEILGFTSKYDVVRLVWWEAHASREAAFKRERAMKKWRRLWKLELIEKGNPGWRDLYEDLVQDQVWVPVHGDPPEA